MLLILNRDAGELSDECATCPRMPKTWISHTIEQREFLEDPTREVEPMKAIGDADGLLVILPK